MIGPAVLPKESRQRGAEESEHYGQVDNVAGVDDDDCLRAFEARRNQYD